MFPAYSICIGILFVFDIRFWKITFINFLYSTIYVFVSKVGSGYGYGKCYIWSVSDWFTSLVMLHCACLTHHWIFLLSCPQWSYLLTYHKCTHYFLTSFILPFIPLKCHLGYFLFWTYFLINQHLFFIAQ